MNSLLQIGIEALAWLFFSFFFGLAREQTVQTAPMSHLCAPNGTVVKKKNTQDERHGYQIIIK